MSRDFWLETIFRPIVVAAMLGSVAVSFVGLARVFFPEWNGFYLVAACVLASLEASYSRRLIRARELRGIDRIYFRVTELLTIFILLKAGTYIGMEWSSIVADIRTWPRDPLRIFNMETIFGFGLVFIAWDLTNQTMSELERVNERHQFRGIYIHPRESLSERYFLGGILLLLVAGLTQIGLGEILNLDRPSVPGVLLNVLIYFLLGLILLGQVHYATLRHRWQLDEIDVTDELPRRWVIYSIVLIGIGALIAFVLPTGYTVGLFGVVNLLLGAIGFVMGLLWYLMLLLFFLLTLPFFILISLLMDEEMERPELEPPPAFTPPAAPGMEGGAPPWYELLRSLIFWIIIMGIATYIIRAYLQDHPEVRHALMSLWPIRMLRRLIVAFGRLLGDWSESVVTRLPREWSIRRRRGGDNGKRMFPFFRIGDLSPAERIRYYFLSIVRRASEQGVPRRRSETPYEYEQTLEQQLATARREMAELTEAFVEARYSRHEISDEKLEQITEDWKRVRAAIRKLERRRAQREEAEDAS